MEKLIDHAPEMEIYIIPDSQMGPEVIRKWNRLAQKNAFSFKAAVKSAGILFAATAVGWLFEKLKLTDANIITVYILGVLLISIVTEGWFYSFSSTIASVLIFNFCLRHHVLRFGLMIAVTRLHLPSCFLRL